MGSEQGGKPLAPAPTMSGGVGDIAPSPAPGSFGLSGLDSGGKDFSQSVNAPASFGAKAEQPYMTGQSLGKRYDTQNDPQMGLGKLDSAYADQKGKDRLKFKMIGMAQKSAEDLVSFRNFGFNPQGMPGEEQPAWQKGYSTNSIYDPMMQQAMQRRQMESVQRFNQGRSTNG